MGSETTTLYFSSLHVSTVSFFYVTLLVFLGLLKKHPFPQLLVLYSGMAFCRLRPHCLGCPGVFLSVNGTVTGVVSIRLCASVSCIMFARPECCSPHKPDPLVPSPLPPTALLTYLHSDWSIVEVGFVWEGWPPE